MCNLIHCSEIRPQVSTSSVLSSSGSSVSASPSKSSLHTTLESVMRLLAEKREKDGRPENIEVCREGETTGDRGKEEGRREREDQGEKEMMLSSIHYGLYALFLLTWK